MRVPENTGQVRNASSVFFVISLYSRPGWTTMDVPLSLLTRMCFPAAVTLV